MLSDKAFAKLSLMADNANAFDKIKDKKIQEYGYDPLQEYEKDCLSSVDFTILKNKEGKYAIFDTKRYEFLTSEWFDKIYPDGIYFKVKKNGKWNFVNKEGKILSPNLWFDNVSGFEYVCMFKGIRQTYELSRVYLNIRNKYNEWPYRCNYIDNMGQLIFPDMWCDYMEYNGRDIIHIENNYVDDYYNITDIMNERRYKNNNEAND